MAFSFFGSSPQPQQQQSLFQTPAQSSPFFQTQQQQQQQLQQQQQQQQQQQLQLQQQHLQQQQPQQQQPQQQQPQQQQLYLLTKDKSPAHYNTKWADLHPDSQKFLLQIEERILEYRDESQRLDQCSRLYEASATNDGFEQDASHIVQELGGISTAMDREKILLQDLMAVVKDLMRNTEVAVRSYMMLRPRFIHPSNPSPSTASTAQMSSGAFVPAPIGQPMSSVAPVFDFYSGVPKRPSPFLQQTVSRFEKYVSECQQLIEELEQLLLNGDGGSSGANLSLLQSLPKVMSNVHEFFIHVAAKVENLHQYIESMKTAYLADQKRRGDASDPFLEADRREIAKQEAAARRVHPTLHLPAQPSTQVAGLFASSSQVTPAVPQPSIGASAASTGSGFSMFGTPSSSAPFLTASSSSLFSTPSSAAPTSSLFGTPSFSPQPSVLGSASPSLFGPAQTPSVFSAQFASGGPMGSGSSFGATSKSAKPKSRTARR